MADSSKKTEENELLQALLSAPAVGTPHAADDETRETWLQRRHDQAEAYGQFLANGPIYVPGTGTLAFTTDAQVPIEHVEKWHLEDAGLVRRVAQPAEARRGVHPSAYVIRKSAEMAEADGSQAASKPAAKSTSSSTTK